MRKNLNRLLAIVLTIALLASFATPAFAAGTSVESVGALLDSYAQSNDETYTLTTGSRIFVVSDSAPTGELLQTAQLIQRQFAAAGYPSETALELVWGPAEYAWEGDIVLKVDTAAGLGTEGYQLDVGSTAMVTANDVDGLLYGANMLMKCFRYGGSMSLMGFTAQDAPDTKQRVVMLDTGRKYYTVDWICNFIRQMSWMGYNAIELHFSEDGGFRADLWDPAYYTGNFQPENDFTWLCGSHVQSWVKDPYRTDPDAGKYLTTAELVQICEVAKEYHIEIIPSFDSPAHMDYITWKFEQNYQSNTSYSFTYDGTTYKASATKGCINYTGMTDASEPSWPYYTTININSDSSDDVAKMAKAFVFALYEDIADFFKEYAGSTNFAIGADEVNLSSGYGIDWTYEDFPVYINSLNRMLNEKGYTCRMFNDFIGSTTYNQSSNAQAVYDFDDNIEIMYWNSDFNPTTGKWDEPIWHVKFFWENNTGSTDDWGDGGRTMYNCIQTNCYYVLRVAASTTDYPNMDARNPKNYNWTFYHSTEEEIYNEWYPADISEKGVYTENAADVPADQLGGAYFLIWNDYASLNTEAEVWEGVKDNTGTSSYVYSLFDRMWSNTMKMWNSDVNSAVSYDGFAKVRDTFAYFPGFTSCSADAKLPAATSVSQATKADHSALETALANKISNADGIYTAESYAAYEEAYSAAEAVNADDASTDDEINAAIDALATAQKNLTKVETDQDPAVEGVTVVFKTMVNGTEKTIESETFAHTGGSYSFYIVPQTGYRFQRAENTVFTPLASGDGSGFITGTASVGATVTLWYENEPDTGRLEYWQRNAVAEQGSYTAESWSAYQTALNAVNNFDVTQTTVQADVDAVVAELESAMSALVTASGSTEILKVYKLADTVRLGKQVGLKVVTTPDVDTLTITGENLTLCTGKVQTLDTGETVKIWLVYFPADTAGTSDYTILAGNASKTVSVTVS